MATEKRLIDANAVYTAKKRMKDRILNALKFHLLVFTMTCGICYNLLIIWKLIGLPQTDWAIWLISASSGLLEYAYLKWVSKT